MPQEEINGQGLESAPSPQPPEFKSDSPVADGPATAAGGEHGHLSAALAAAEAAAREHQDAWLRAKAETENVRKRSAADLSQARKYALESFSTELLAVRDSLEAALGVANADVDSYRSGVELTLRQMAAVFEKFQISEINPLNEKFDPHRHQAIAAVASDVPPNTVLTVMQKGYALHERVLRPALVTVSKAAEN